MASHAQLRANRENAKKSTGPRTTNGKKRSSKNAVRHGLLSEDWFIDGEEERSYSQLLTELEDTLSPVGPMECALVERIAIAMCRQRRLTIAEGAMVRLSRRDESVQRQIDSSSAYGRTTQCRFSRLAPYKEREAEAEKDAARVRKVMAEMEALPKPTSKIIKAKAPEIYRSLSEMAERYGKTPEEYYPDIPQIRG